MPDKNKHPFWKRMLIDVVGFSLLIATPFVGAIPGPGGTILLVASLSILSINHEWARKLLHEVKTRGSSLYDFFFPENRWVKWLYDIGGILVIGTALYLRYNATQNWLDTAAIAIFFIGGGLLLVNRKRMEKLVAFLKRIKP